VTPHAVFLAAYSFGVKLPSDACGLAPLKSILHASIFVLASSRSVNQFWSRHSSRSLPLKLST